MDEHGVHEDMNYCSRHEHRLPVRTGATIEERILVGEVRKSERHCDCDCDERHKRHEIQPDYEDLDDSRIPFREVRRRVLVFLVQLILRRQATLAGLRSTQLAFEKRFMDQ